MKFSELKEAVEIFSKYVDDNDIKVFEAQLMIDCESVEDLDEKRLDELGWYQDHHCWVADLA